MKTATVHELKKELQDLAQPRLVELCLKLARFKKENKEILTYLLFESGDEQGYIDSVKSLISGEFEDLPKTNLYLTKKSLRKLLRITNKYIRYTGSKQAETELLLYFCLSLKNSSIDVHRSTSLNNLYLQQIKKVKAAVATLHEDLQHDFARQLEKLSG